MAMSAGESRADPNRRWRGWAIVGAVVIVPVALWFVVGPWTYYSHPIIPHRDARVINTLQLCHANQVVLKQRDGAFAKNIAGGGSEGGYCFADMETIAGKPIDWRRDFALCAVPATYGRTGSRTFVVKTDGRVWARDLGADLYLLEAPLLANRDRPHFVADFPADPEAEGWVDPEAEARLRQLKGKIVSVLCCSGILGAVTFSVWFASWLYRNPRHRATRMTFMVLTFAGLLAFLTLAGWVLFSALRAHR
jgi:hypothetical protein